MNTIRRTTMARPDTINQKWFAIDGTDQIVGRLAVRIATMLMGKHKPTYTPHIDCGDFIVVTNCEKVAFTGNKWNDKVYRRHSGYIGGMKVTTAAKMRDSHPDRILRKAVQRMLPKNKLARGMLNKLKMYVGPDHPHAAQQPETLVVNAKIRS